jgi:hypothetical protein
VLCRRSVTDYRAAVSSFDGWSRETIESKCVLAREKRGTFLALYIARVRVTAAPNLSDRNQLHLVATRQSDAAAGSQLGLNTKNDIADYFLRLAVLPTFALDRLSRYEHLLWRQARQIVFTLETLRRRKPQPPTRPTFPFSIQAARARCLVRRA